MRMTSERKAETRERILASAGELFRSHGIDGVGLDAVMHHAGLTHGGFYAHFASNEALWPRCPPLPSRGQRRGGGGSATRAIRRRRWGGLSKAISIRPMSPQPRGAACWPL